MRYMLMLPLFISSVAYAAERYDPDNELCHTSLESLMTNPDDVRRYNLKEKYEQRCIKPVSQIVVKKEVIAQVVTEPLNNPFIDECVSLTMNRLMCYELWQERSR